MDRVQFHSGTNEGFEGFLVNLVAFMDVDGAPGGLRLVEQVRRVLQQSTLEESEFDSIFLNKIFGEKIKLIFNGCTFGFLKTFSEERIKG